MGEGPTALENVDKETFLKNCKNLTNLLILITLVLFITQHRG